MKKIILSLATVASLAAQVVWYRTNSTIVWDKNPETDLEGYRLYMQSSRSNIALTSLIIKSNLVTLTNHLWNLPSDKYNIWVTAVSLSGLESEPSETIGFSWAGKPTKPGGSKVSFTNNAEAIKFLTNSLNTLNQ